MQTRVGKPDERRHSRWDTVQVNTISNMRTKITGLCQNKHRGLKMKHVLSILRKVLGTVSAGKCTQINRIYYKIQFICRPLSAPPGVLL